MPKQNTKTKDKDKANKKWESCGEDAPYLYRWLLATKNRLGNKEFIAENNSWKDMYVQRNLSRNISTAKKIYNTLKTVDVS